MSLGRKTFISASPLAAAAALTSCKNNGSAQAGGYAEFFPVLKPKDYLSGEAVLARGGSFIVCHNALANFAAGAAARVGKSSSMVLDDMVHNLLSGFKVVPAGVTAIQLAQEHGWKLYTVA